MTHETDYKLSLHGDIQIKSILCDSFLSSGHDSFYYMVEKKNHHWERPRNKYTPISEDLSEIKAKKGMFLVFNPNPIIIMFHNKLL